VPPAPKLPVPLVADIADPTIRPVVEDMPVIVAFHGPVPLMDPTVPVVLTVPDATDPSSRFLSSTTIVDEFTVVVVPLTTKSPVTVKLPPTLVFPVVLIAVKLVVPVNVGPELNTRTPPDPVSSEMTPANSDDVVAANTESLFAVYATVPPAPNATEEASVPVKVSVLLTVRVLPSAIVRVAEVIGAVIATLLMLVAVAAPRDGVDIVGLVRVLLVKV
jgi:hypothetical protein